jgi:Undecaprenyl-phosphate galactose phosphotransferase WbaP
MTTAAAAIVAQRRVLTPSPALLMAGIRAAMDIATLSFAVLAGFRLWLIVNPSIPFHPLTMWVAVGLCFVAFAFSGLYPGVGMTAVEHIRRMSRSISLVYLLLSASMFLVKDWRNDSRGGFLLSWVFSLAFVPLGRWVSGRYLCERQWWGIPVMILGAGETARTVIDNLRANEVLGYRPVVCLDDDPQRQGSCLGVPVPGGLANARYFADAYRTRCAVIAMPRLPRENLVQRLEEWSRIFLKIVVVPDLFGVASLWTAPRDLGGVLGLEIQCNLLNPLNQLLKRTTDIVISAICLAAAAPLFAIAAIRIKRAGPGPVFYYQEREGKYGKRIRVFKLRTMRPGAEKTLERYLAGNSAATEEWDRFCKLKCDPRVIPGVGSWLRKTSLDELPQLWNILRGEMSLVGPRPFPHYHTARFHPEFQSLRTQVTPGLTGLWQITARSDGDLEVQRSLDSYYIRNWSPWLDLYILIRTIRTVLARDGAY